MSEKTLEQVQQHIGELVEKGKAAQKYFERNYKTQKAVDEVVRAVGKVIYDHAEDISRGAVAETSMGNLEGKIFKVRTIALGQWNMMKGKQTVGLLDVEGEPGVKMMPKPLGIIGCVMPSTNPIATAVGNSMMALKCRNAVIIAPHPGSAKVSQKTVDLIREALAAIGAPEDLVQCIGSEFASIDATGEMLKRCDVNIATGGAGMVKAVYSAGRPAFGVGQGNCQAIVDEDWTDYKAMAAAAVTNRAFDLGVPCTGEQTVILPEEHETEFLEAMAGAGAFVVHEKEAVDQLRRLIFPDEKGMINRAVVGRTPVQLGGMIGMEIPAQAGVICMKNQAKGDEDVLCKEILCPVIRYTTYKKFEEAVEIAVANLEKEGAGHSSSIWSNNREHIEAAADVIPVGRFHVNQATIGMGNGTPNTVTIGCGSWGNNSISENLQYYHLMNKTRITMPLDNLREFKETDWDDYSEFHLFND